MYISKLPFLLTFMNQTTWYKKQYNLKLSVKTEHNSTSCKRKENVNSFQNTATI